MQNKPTEMTPISKGAQFIIDAYKSCFTTSKATRIKIPWVISESAMIAVKYGFPFAVDDFTHMQKALAYGAGYHAGNHVWDIGDGHYAAAVGSERGLQNIPFASAYEKFHKFKPYIIKDTSQSGRRIYLGMDLQWEGKRWRVSSWGKEHAYVNLIQNKHERKNYRFVAGGVIHTWDEQSHSRYHRIVEVSEDGATIQIDPQPLPEENGVNSVTKRTRITPEDLKRFNAEAKETYGLLQPLFPLQDYGWCVSAYISAGIEKTRAFAEEARNKEKAHV